MNRLAGFPVTTFWKALAVVNFIVALLAAFYAYAAHNPNPYGASYYEREEMKQELRRLAGELESLREKQEASVK